jgi:gliding motility-associated-like protein
MYVKKDRSIFLHGIILLIVYVLIYISAVKGQSINQNNGILPINANPPLVFAFAPEPTIPSSGVVQSIANCNQIKVDFVAGNGAGRIIVIKKGSPVDKLPVDNTSYSADPTFGMGSHLGNGNYVIYKGSGQKANFLGLTPGITYHLAIFEFNGLASNVNYLTSIYPAFNIPVPIDIKLNDQVQNITCNGNGDGKITLNITGGTAPFNYQWNVAGNGPVLSNLQPGTYEVTVNDAVGCIKSKSYQITEPAVLMAELKIDPIFCFGDEDGKITVIPKGGTAPYTFEWSTQANTAMISNLKSGIYAVTINDSHNCSLTKETTLTQPDKLQIQAEINDISCNGGNDGKIIIQISGGSPAYDILWDNGNDSLVLQEIPKGNYGLTIMDDNACRLDTSFIVNEPDSLKISIKANHITCLDEVNGSVEANISGGKPPYQYAWSNGESTQKVNNLNEGLYSVTATDINGCIIIDSALVTITNDPVRCDLDLEVNDLFTPNGDGVNDFFNIDGIEDYADNVLEIFNRWGNPVYKQTNYQNDWDGTDASGRKLATGTYYYILKVYSNSEFVISGSVTFIR